MKSIFGCANVCEHLLASIPIPFFLLCSFSFLLSLLHIILQLNAKKHTHTHNLPCGRRPNAHNGHAYDEINNNTRVCVHFVQSAAWNLKLIDCDSSSVAFVIWQLINRRASTTAQAIPTNARKRNDHHHSNEKDMQWAANCIKKSMLAVYALACFFPMSLLLSSTLWARPFTAVAIIYTVVFYACWQSHFNKTFNLRIISLLCVRAIDCLQSVSWHSVILTWKNASYGKANEKQMNTQQRP